MTHGQRQTYQHGCSCPSCRAANARYVAHLRGQHARGECPLGAHVSAVDTWRLIHRMKIEHYTQAMIAKALGLKQGRLTFHTTAVTLRTQLKVRRLYRLRMLDDAQ